MEHEAGLTLLEKNVEKLLSRLDELYSDNQKLQSDIDRLTGENQTLQAEISLLQNEAARLKEEKGIIHQRVSTLIGAIEKWEKAATKKEAEVPDREAAGKSVSPSQGALGF